MTHKFDRSPTRFLLPLRRSIIFTRRAVAMDGNAQHQPPVIDVPSAEQTSHGRELAAEIKRIDEHSAGTARRSPDTGQTLGHLIRSNPASDAVKLGPRRKSKSESER